MDRPIEACGVILAGGQSRRMGTNKALLELEGETLIARLARRFTDWFAQVVIVTNSPELYASLGLPMVSDRIPGLGPLVGLEAGLQASRFDKAFFCAVDMPFVNQGLVRYMLDQAEGYDIVVPFLGGDYEPMHAVYSKGCLPAIAQSIETQRLRLISIYGNVRRRDVTAEEVGRFGDPERLFFNCNTPAEIARARRWIADSQEG